MSERAGVEGGVAERRVAIRSPQNFAAGASLVAVAAIAIWASADLGQGRFYAVGPALLPRAVATLLAVIGIGLAAGALIKKGDALSRWSLRGPLFVFIAVVAFALSVRTVGLAVAGPVVALVSGAASPETRPRELLVFPLLVTALSIGLFRYMLHLPIQRAMTLRSTPDCSRCIAVVCLTVCGEMRRPRSDGKRFSAAVTAVRRRCSTPDRESGRP